MQFNINYLLKYSIKYSFFFCLCKIKVVLEIWNLNTTLQFSAAHNYSWARVKVLNQPFFLCVLRKREESSDYLNFHFILHLRTKRGQKKGNEVWKHWKNSSSKPFTGLIQREMSSKSLEWIREHIYGINFCV